MTKTNIVYSYGKCRIVRPYEIRKYISYFKWINIALSIIIVGLYPIPLSIAINKIIDKKIKITEVIRW